MSPFVKMFPVGLGLKVLYISSIFVVLIFSILNSVFGFFRHKRRWSIIMFVIAVIFFISAHFQSSFNKERQKPNSLVYILDTDQGEAAWATYDNVLDSWTQNFLGKSPQTESELTKTALASKYNTGFTFTSEAPVKPLLEPNVEILKDTVIGDSRELSIHIKSNRDVDRIEFFADEQIIFKEFRVNGVNTYKKNNNSFAFENRINDRLFTYYVVDSEPLEMHFTIPKNQLTTIEFFESSADLLSHKLFTVPKRDETMMPKPFILNDAVVIKKTIVIE